MVSVVRCQCVLRWATLPERNSNRATLRRGCHAGLGTFGVMNACDTRRIMPVLHRIARWLRAMAADDALVRHELALRNMRRLRWLLPALIALLLLLFAFVSPSADGPAAEQAWRRALVQVYYAIGVWLVLLTVLVWWVLRTAAGATAMRVVQQLAALGFLLITVALAVVDQWVTPAISPYLLGCMMVSLLLLLPPATACWLFAIAYLALFVGLDLTQADEALLLSNRINGFSASVLGLLLAFGQWRSSARYLMLQRELTLRNAALEKQQDELLWLAAHDALTGLYNRREFMRLAELELKRAQRQGGFTSAIVIDLDHFKAINDTHGHPAGDKVLADVARLLHDGVRTTDLVARIGGEEFMVLLPQTDIDAAAGLGHKLRGLLRGAPVTIGAGSQLAVTASFGVGSLPGGALGSVASLYAAADKALYDAKRLGRDRVERVEPDASLTPSDFQRMRR